MASDSRPEVAVTVSLGVADTAAWPIEPDALLARADAACYRAKEGGRDACVVDEGPAITASPSG